jgi:hypothetical protein
MEAPTPVEVPEPGVQDVDYTQAKIDQSPETDSPQNPQEDPAEVLDALVPRGEPRLWKLGPNGELEFVQRPLSFIAKMQWFALVGDVLDRALSGENGMSVNSLFSAPQRPDGSFSVDDFKDADTFIQAIGKLLSYAPDFLTKSYCIWLGVPDYQRDVVGRIMAMPPEEGGLTDEQGVEIIEIFIDQNYEAIDRFFRELVAGLQKRIKARAAAASRPAASSKP